MGAKYVEKGYVVVMKTWRKHGNGAKGAGGGRDRGTGRKGSTGKRGILYRIIGGGRQVVKSAEGATAKMVTKILRSTGLIPTDVAINNNGETYFET